MSPEAQRGRLLVITAIVITFIGNAVTDFLTSHFSPVNWLLTAALFLALWFGQRWARWLLVGLSAAAPLVGLLFLRGGLPPLFIGVSIQCLIVALLLAFPPSVSAFLRFQRRRPAARVPVQRPIEPQEHVDPY